MIGGGDPGPIPATSLTNYSIRAEYSLWPSGLIWYRTLNDSGGYCRSLPQVRVFLDGSGVTVEDKTHSTDAGGTYGAGIAKNGRHYEGCIEATDGVTAGWSCQYRADDIMVTRPGSTWDMVQSASAMWARNQFTTAACLLAVRNREANDVVNDCS